MLKSSLKEVTPAFAGDAGGVVKGPIVDSAAQVPVHLARDRDQQLLSDIILCPVP